MAHRRKIILLSRDEVIALVQAHKGELGSDVVGVSLFGSTARGEKTAQNIDVAVPLTKEFSRPGFDYFGRLEPLEEQLQNSWAAKWIW